MTQGQIEPAADATDTSTHDDDLTADLNDCDLPHDSAEDSTVAMTCLDDVFTEG